jgi:hypothetical protein
MGASQRKMISPTVSRFRNGVAFLLAAAAGVTTRVAAVPPPPIADLYAGKALVPYYAFAPTWIAPANANYQRRSEASAETLKNGDVFVAWCDLVGHSDNARGYISAVELSPQGVPRGEPRIVVPTPPNGLNSLSPSVRRLANGELGLAFSYRMNTKEASRRFMFSRDEGHTWSEPVLVSDGSDPYMTGCNDRLTVHSSGRLLAPLHCSDDWDKHHLHVKTSWSDDHGRTWQTTKSKLELPYVRWESRKIGLESGPHEPGIAERADSSLLMTLRTPMGTQFFSESFDRGETWSDPRSLELTSPLAPAHLSRIPGTDKLLMIWTPNYESAKAMMGKRNTIMACVSDDGGRSWPYAKRKIIVHDPTKSTDYPSVLYYGDEVWITLRISSGSGVLQGLTGTGLVRVPLAWLEK